MKRRVRIGGRFFGVLKFLTKLKFSSEDLEVKDFCVIIICFEGK